MMSSTVFKLILKNHFKHTCKRFLKKTIFLACLLIGTWFAACAFVQSVDTNKNLEIRNLDYPAY